MRNLNIFKITIALLSICASGANAQVSSEWNQVPIGGGGRTFGFIGSPSSDMLYLRTDVAGMYKKLPSDPAWTRLTDGFDPTYGERMEGCAGLGLHPNTDDILYAALSRGIYKSTNGGATWSQTLNLRIFTNGFSGDRDDRNYGEALVVDRANGEVVYYGSQDNGLYYTRDGGNNWSQLSGNDFPTLGSRSIVVDHTRDRVDVGTPNERSKYVYVTVKTQGIYRSEDGGDTFTQWTASLPDGLGGTSGNYVRYLRISKEGELYAAHNKGLARWNGSSWEDISPTVGPDGTNIEVRTVAADPLDNNVVICSRARYTDASGNTVNAAIYRSNDRGDTWEGVPTQVGSLANWGRGRYEPNQVNAFSIYIDDQASAPANRAYISSSYHAWKTDDIWTPVTTWDAMQEGNEMTINITGTSLPGASRARLLTGMADVRGFIYYEDDLDQYPDRQTVIPESLQAQGFFTPNFPGIDFCESNPDVVWFSASRKPGYVPLVFRSTNGGDLLDEVSNPSIGTSFENIGEGGLSAGGPKIAVSASDPDNAVVLIKKNLRYTKDGGLTWNTPGGVSTINSGLDSNIEYEFDDLVQSDRVNGNTFYVYDRNGEFYRSYDGGETFNRVTSENLPGRGSVQGGFASARGGGAKMVTAPGIEGELWISTGSNGIWKTNGTAPNRTDTFEEITFFQKLNPTCVSFGAAKPGSTTPTAYVSGARRADGLWGVWKSEDLGENWTLVTPIDVPGQWIRNLYADREVYGRVFVGDASFGVRSLTLTETPLPEDIIVDNNTTGFSVQGTWATATFAGGGQTYIGPNYRVNRQNSAGTATYVPTIETAGTYNVYARWIASGDRDSAVEIDINDGTNIQTVVVDQKQNGGKWALIGTVDLEEGNNSFVRINNDIVTPPAPGKTQSVTVADAIRWEYVDDSSPVRPSGFKINSINTRTLELEWFDNASNEGGFIIERSVNDLPFAELARVGAGEISYIDNTVEFNKSYQYSVRAFNSFGESTRVFVTFDNSEIIIDNNTPGFQTQGSNWATATFAPSGQSFFGNNYRVNRTTSPGTATYSTAITVSGIYGIEARWISVGDRDDSVKYVIDNAGKIEEIFIDQTQNGGDWRLLTYQYIEAGTELTLTIENDLTPDKITVADAVRLIYESESLPEAPTGLMAQNSLTTIDLTWTDNASDELGFAIERKTEGGEYAPLAVVEANITNYEDATVEPGSKYFYRVKALGEFLDSDYSNEAQAFGAYLSIKVKNEDRHNPDNAVIKTRFKIKNDGAETVPLEEITMRYWFTNENNGPLRDKVVVAPFPKNRVIMNYMPITNAVSGADYYLEVSFTEGAINPGQQLGSFIVNTITQLSVFDETDDYSYTNDKDIKTSEKLTLYRNGELIWGVEPIANDAIERGVTPSLFVKIKNEDRFNPENNRISTRFKLHNYGNEDVPLTEVKMRYWFTNESGDANLSSKIVVSPFSKKNGPVNVGYAPLVSPMGGADYYMEVSFNEAVLAADSELGSLLIKTTASSGQFSETDDYSYVNQQDNLTTRAVTIYRNDELIWGEEPQSTSSVARMAQSKQDLSKEAEVVLEVVVYPNPVPSTGELKIRVPSTANPLNLSLVNLQGKIYDLSDRFIAEGNSEISIPLSSLALKPGLYLLNIQEEGVENQMIKLFIR